ncbi:hypothetical protein ACFTUC_09995 [Streptomyces sp. NPDC056944]|uniref:hypothetical protein n=1 Tax=Streptomyces sp. NPDC056944 TaxID=3345972 RepID=UPI003628F9E8
MHVSQTNGTSDRTARIPAPRSPSPDAAEAALVEHYPALVRLAHLILPPALGRHRRVLAAHALVQRSLARRGGTHAGGRGVGVGVGVGGEDSAHDWLRERVVRGALRPPLTVALGVALPRALGLRVFPRAGGTDELALDRALAAADPATRAALALTALEGLAPASVVALLHAVGVADPERAVSSAERLGVSCGPGTAGLLRGPEFDPCTVHLRPTDLLGRRRRIRFAALAGVLVLLGGSAVAALDGSPASTPRPVVSAAPAGVVPVRVPAERWADTSRVDFTAWPARGDRADDQGLLRRAVAAWAGGSPRTAEPEPRTAGSEPRTAGSERRTPGSEPPSLLYAGDVDGARVVLLHTGRSLVRYTEPGTGHARPTLVETRADDSDVTTAAAVVLTRAGGRTRYLLAPWIAEAGVRDLRDPRTAARPLRVSADGATDPVSDAAPQTAGSGGCAGLTALQLRSSTRIVEDHAFLLVDLGGLSPVHLTWTPLPVPGDPARSPREAAGPLGLAAWSHAACSLPLLRDSGVRAVNRWEFAAQTLPERAGRALWICSRADTWEGRGRVDVTLELPGGAVPVTTVRDTAACGRFGQDVLAGTFWSAPHGTRYVLAAGSRRIVGVSADGAVRAGARGRVLAVRAGTSAPFRLSGRLPDGSSLPGWTTRTVEGGG